MLGRVGAVAGQLGLVPGRACWALGVCDAVAPLLCEACVAGAVCPLGIWGRVCRAVCALQGVGVEELLAVAADAGLLAAVWG